MRGMFWLAADIFGSKEGSSSIDLLRPSPEIEERLRDFRFTSQVDTTVRVLLLLNQKTNMGQGFKIFWFYNRTLLNAQKFTWVSWV
jgi:hypothetical protein